MSGRYGSAGTLGHGPGARQWHGEWPRHVQRLSPLPQSGDLQGLLSALGGPFDGTGEVLVTCHWHTYAPRDTPGMVSETTAGLTTGTTTVGVATIPGAWQIPVPALYPDNAIIEAVTYRLDTPWSGEQGLTSFHLGDAAGVDRWGRHLGRSLGATTPGLFTAYAPYPSRTSQAGTLSAVGGPFGSQGAAWVTCHWRRYASVAEASPPPESPSASPALPDHSVFAYHLLPPLGTAGQLLTLESTAELSWQDPVAVPGATETQAGLVELATAAEVTTGSNDLTAVTPLKLQQRLSAVAPPAASETVSGLIELATSAEVTTGTDTQRAVTPAGLAGRFGVVQTFTVTCTGFTTVLTGTASYSKIGRWVLLQLPQMSGTGDSTGTLLIQGLPAAVLPQDRLFVPLITQDGGSLDWGRLDSIGAGSTQFEVYRTAAAPFTAGLARAVFPPPLTYLTA